MDGNEPFLSQIDQRPRPRPPTVPPVVPREGSQQRSSSAPTGQAKQGATGATHAHARSANARAGGSVVDQSSPSTGRDEGDAQQNVGPTSYTKLGYTEFQNVCARQFAETFDAIDAALDKEQRDEERKQRERKEAQARIAETMERNPNVSRAPKRISFLPLVERVRIHAEKIKDEREKCNSIPRLSVSYGDSRYNERPSDGETVYKQLLECFISFKDQPTAFQHKLFTAIASACAPLIFGEEFFSDPARCLQIIGGRFTDGLVGILTGRKTGKSTGLAYIAICLMFVIKKFKGIIVSKTLEQAKIILDTVKGLIQSHPWWSAGGYRVIESRATALVIQGPDGSLRVLEARCGSGEVRIPPLVSCRYRYPWNECVRFFSL